MKGGITLAILVSGFCSNCGTYYEFSTDTVIPPANLYITVNKDGTNHIEMLCANYVMCKAEPKENT